MTFKNDKIIISNDDYWTYIKSADFKLPKEWNEHGGKFMVFGDEDTILFFAHILICHDEIKCLKYAPPAPEMGYKRWALMVYCLDTEQDNIWAIMQQVGIVKKLWKYDKQTNKDWQSDGRLYKQLVRS